MLSVTLPLEADDATTERILDAAYDELLAFGIKRVSVEDIAKRCGVARVTIYRRFANRDELLGAVALREGRRLFAELDRTAGTGDIDTQLVEGFVVLLDTVRNHPIVQRTLATEPEIAASMLTSQAAPIIGLARDYLATRIAVAQADGQLPKFDPRPVAELIVRLSASFVLTPESCIAMQTAKEARAFARAHLVPMIHP